MEFDSTQRIFWLKLIITAAIMSGFLLARKLWQSSRSYPTAPFFKKLPIIPYEGALVVVFSLLLVAVAFAGKPGIYILAFVTLGGLFCLYDQARWQPWFYQYLCMLAALGIYFWNEKDPVSEQGVLNTCRLMIVCIYFWSGLQKLNAGFFRDLFPWLIKPVTKFIPGRSKALVYRSAYLIPFAEMALAIGLLTPQLRMFAIPMAIGTHLFILLCLGPLGHNYNTIIWPWNIAMILFDLVLFWGIGSTGFQEILIGHGFIFQKVILVFFGIMPIFSFLNLWDGQLSFQFYSGNAKYGFIFVKEAGFNQLPEGLRSQFICNPKLPDLHMLNVLEWSMKELNVPPYPEERVFRKIARSFCRYGNNDMEISLVVTGKPGLLNGIRPQKVYLRSSLFEGE